jgi:KTSC domain
MPSTVIERSSYDPSTRTLSVWFRQSERRYDYQDVPPETYAAYQEAFSKGRFFNRFIRDKFKHRWIAYDEAKG